MNIRKIQRSIINNAHKLMLWGTCAVLLSGCFSFKASRAFQRLDRLQAVEMNPRLIDQDLPICQWESGIYVGLNYQGSLPPYQFLDQLIPELEHTFFDDIILTPPVMYVNRTPSFKEFNGRMWYRYQDPITIERIRAQYPQVKVWAQIHFYERFPKRGPLFYMAVECRFVRIDTGETLMVLRKNTETWRDHSGVAAHELVAILKPWLLQVQKACLTQGGAA